MGTRPTATYLPALVGVVAQPVAWLGENYLQLQPWWPKMPWGLVSALSLAFMFGLLAQDLYNRDSWARQLWRSVNQLFDHAACWWEQPSNEPARREAYSRLIFTRDLKNAELRLWGYDNGNMAPKLIESRVGQTYLKGADLRVILATVPIHETSPLDPRFGDQHNPLILNPQGAKLVVLEMRCGRRKQTVPVEIYVSPPGDQWTIHPISEGASPFLWPRYRAKP